MSTRDLTPVAQGRISNRLPSTCMCERSWGGEADLSCLLLQNRKFLDGPIEVGLGKLLGLANLFLCLLRKVFFRLDGCVSHIEKLMIFCGGQGDVDEAEGKI